MRTVAGMAERASRKGRSDSSDSDEEEIDLPVGAALPLNRSFTGASRAENVTEKNKSVGSNAMVESSDDDLKVTGRSPGGASLGGVSAGSSGARVAPAQETGFFSEEEPPRRRSVSGYYADDTLDESGLAPRSAARKTYTSDEGNLSEEESMRWRRRNTVGENKSILNRLPMIPSRSRFENSNRLQRSARSSRKKQQQTLPRKIPRRVKGKFRRIVAEREEELPIGRVACHCPGNELDLDELYAHMRKVRQKSGVPGLQLVDPEFSFETNKELIVPLIMRDEASASSSYAFHKSKKGRNSVEDPTWIASIFFDVLHLRQACITTQSSFTNDSFRSAGEPTKPTASGAAMGFSPRSSTNAVISREEADTGAESFREVFLFGFGAVVFWNWEAEEELEFVKSILPHCRGYYNVDVAEAASDDLEYFHGDKSGVKHDTVQLGTGDPMERLAFSFAIAQSSLLSVYEFRLDEAIKRNEHIPVALAATGKIVMSQVAISKEIGRLFMERNMINLESDVTTCPEIFWENDEWEPVYKRMCSYMEHEERHEVLNKRLDCLHELLDVLSTQVENQHASKLEWIIIYLILIEVVNVVFWQMILKDIFGFFNHCND